MKVVASHLTANIFVYILFIFVCVRVAICAAACEVRGHRVGWVVFFHRVGPRDPDSLDLVQMETPTSPEALNSSSARILEGLL